MTFTFTATQDTVDDEGESVLLGLRVGPVGRGELGNAGRVTTLTITDDDPPEVSFGQDSYSGRSRAAW